MKNLQRIWGKVKEHALRQEQGIDGILVTVGQQQPPGQSSISKTA